ncbi:MAG TPA: hypothetical protein VF691_16555, partial [Cytophagaceae bacterium]
DRLYLGGIEEVQTLFFQRFPTYNFEQARKHLYVKILKSLRSFEEQKSIDNRLMNSLQNIQILFKKGAYRLCFEEIRKSKKIALDNEKHLFYIMYTRAEMEIHSHFSYVYTEEKKLQKESNEIISLLEKEVSTQKHSNLYHILMNRYVTQGHTRTKNDQDKLNDLLLEEFQLSSKLKNSFESDKIHLLFQSAYFLMVANPKASLRILKDLYQLFINHKALWKENPVHYIYMFDNILAEMSLAGDFESMSIFIADLQALEIVHNSIWRFVRSIVLKYNLLIAYHTSDEKKSNVLLFEFESQLNCNAGEIPFNTSLNLLYTVSLSYFGIRQFRKALGTINLLLNDRSANISLQMRSMCRIINLLIHLELENVDLVAYEIRSLERSLAKKKSSFELEELCIQFMKKWLRNTNKKPIIKKLLVDIQVLKESPVEARLLKQLPIEKWLQSKILKL